MSKGTRGCGQSVDLTKFRLTLNLGYILLILNYFLKFNKGGGENGSCLMIVCFLSIVNTHLVPE